MGFERGGRGGGFAPRGGRGGGGFRGGRGGRGGFGGGGYNSGPPERLGVVAEVSHNCEGVIIGMVKGNAVPLLARMIWTEKKQLIGKVEDVFGPKTQPGIAVAPDSNSGVKAESFKAGDKVS